MAARYFGIIPAAGTGQRFGGGLPKQYQPLAGSTVLRHAVDALLVDSPVTRVYVVHAPEDDRCAQMLDGIDRVTTLAAGGDTRARSVSNALTAMGASAVDVSDDDWVLVHDAARPCLPHDALMRLLREVGDDPVGGLLAIPVTDTLKRETVDGDRRSVASTEPRAGLWQAQTPQMFRFGLLRDALRPDRPIEVTDESQAVEMTGMRPRLVHGSTANIKITVPSDLALAEALLAARAAPLPSKT